MSATEPQDSALATLVAVLTAELAGADIDRADLMEGADQASLIRLLIAMNVALLSRLADRGAGLLAALGLEAAARQRSPGDRGNT